MITSIRPYNINNIYQPKFTANKKPNEYMVSISYDNFTQDVLNDLLEEWDEKGLVDDGDSMFIMPQSHFKTAAKYDKRLSKTYPRANLSKNGFAVTLMDKDGGIKTEALKYFDPRVMSVLKITHSLKNNVPYIFGIDTIYDDI